MSVISIVCFIIFWRLNPQIHFPVAQKKDSPEKICEASNHDTAIISKFELDPSVSSEDYKSELQDKVHSIKSNESGRVEFVRQIRADPEFMTCQLDTLN